MKIKRIIDLCKKRKHFLIFHDEANNIQWLSDKYAIYPLLKMPMLDKEYICSMYDITDSQKDKIFFKSEKELPQHLNFNDTDETETQTKINEMAIVYNGKILLPIETERGLKFIENQYLTPFADINKNDLSLTLRINQKGQEYFAVKEGLLLYGLISPCDIINNDFVNQLNHLYKLSGICLKNQQEKERANAT